VLEVTTPNMLDDFDLPQQTCPVVPLLCLLFEEKADTEWAAEEGVATANCTRSRQGSDCGADGTAQGWKVAGRRKKG
jgi:hypothetical protein